MTHPYIYIYISGHCPHVTETCHGRFRARRIPSRNYGIAARHGASRNITDITEAITAHHGAEPITDSHGRDACECCQGVSRRVASLPSGNWLSDKTFQRSASLRITAHHGESRSITEITEHHVHHGVRHGASRSGPHHGRSQHGLI